MQPRKQVRPVLRRDVHIVPQQYAGRQCYVVKDPVTLRYFRFQEAEHFILHHLDGKHTLAEVREEFERRFRPRRLPLEEVESFTRQMVSTGLVTARPTAEGLMRTRREVERRERLAFWSNLLSVQVPLFDPDRLLGRARGFAALFFSRTACLLGLALVLAAVMLVATHFDAFWARLPERQQFFTWHNVGYLWLALGLAKVGHELGHALSCKAFGGEVHELGVMLLCLSPCLYCDVSDAWMLPRKWRRIFVSCAGIYVELLIAAAATFVWWNAASRPFLQHLCLSLMLVCSAGTLFFNANPLLRYDGYYALADWLELPNLLDESRQHLLHGAGSLVFGLPWRRRWRPALALFGLASVLYRWCVTAFMVWFLYRFLKPHKLETIGLLAAFGSVGLMLTMSLARLGRLLTRDGMRWEAMNRQRLLTSTGLVLLFFAAFAWVPLPLGGTRQVGLVQVRPDAVESVYLPAAAVLEKLHVRNGQRVPAGALLAEFRSRELENLRAAAAAEGELLTVQANLCRERLAGNLEAADRAAVAAQLAKAVAERPRLAREIQVYDKMLASLQLRAQRAGIVLGLPRVEEMGKLWEADPHRPFCRVAETERLWVVVPLETADFRRLQGNEAACHRHGRELTARVRVPGRGAGTWLGRVAQMPDTDAAEIPAALTQRAGGPVAIRVGAPDGQPLSQQYLVGIQIVGADAALRPGGLATVAIRGRWRTAAQYVWQLLAETFDLGFIS